GGCDRACAGRVRSRGRPPCWLDATRAWLPLADVDLVDQQLIRDPPYFRSLVLPHEFHDVVSHGVRSRIIMPVELLFCDHLDSIVDSDDSEPIIRAAIFEPPQRCNIIRHLITLSFVRFPIVSPSLVVSHRSARVLPSTSRRFLSSPPFRRWCQCGCECK